MKHEREGSMNEAPISLSMIKGGDKKVCMQTKRQRKKRRGKK